MGTEVKQTSSTQESGQHDTNRREFLKTAGKFAAYTPPSIMMLMHPSANAIMKSAVGRANNGIGQEKRGLIDGPPPGLAGKPYADFNDHGAFAPYGRSGAQAGGRPK